MEWFYDLELFEKIYWIVAITASAVFVVILLMTFLGGDVDSDVYVDADGDVDGVGFQFFTFKNMVGFFTIFGWTGIGCIRSDFETYMVLIVSVLCGLLMMLAMSALFYFISNLVEDGTMKMSNAVDRTGEVYLPISAKNGGFGKVQINIQGSLHEIQAFTNDDEDLAVGTIVRVQQVIDNHILLVTSKLS